MATKKKKDLNEIIMNVAKAGAGGIGAEILTDAIVKASPQMIQDNPKLAEIIPIAAGAAGLFFMPDNKLDPVFYGMIGAGASGFADDLMSGMQGFQRVQYMNGQVADEMNAGVAMIDKMQGIAFEDVEVVDEETDGGMN